MADERRASQRLAQLNAAVASLIQTSADRDTTDYTAGEEAVRSITKLMPDIINDVKLLSTVQDEKTRQHMKEQLKTLNDAVYGIFEAVENDNIKDANDTYSKYVGAIRNLNAVVDANANSSEREERTDVNSRGAVLKVNEELVAVDCLIKDAYKIGSDIAADASELAALQEGEAADRLATSAERVVDAVQLMYSTIAEEIQVSKGFWNKNNVLTAIEAINAASLDLDAAYNPLKQDPAFKELVEQIELKKGKLDSKLDDLRDACKEVLGNQVTQQDSDEKTAQWLTFISNVSDAKHYLQESSTEIDN